LSSNGSMAGEEYREKNQGKGGRLAVEKRKARKKRSDNKRKDTETTREGGELRIGEG